MELNNTFNSGYNPVDYAQSVLRNQPCLFSYDRFWQHKQPLLDRVSDLYGNLRLETLGGSYGWSVRYRQIEDYEGLGVNTLGEYIEAFRAGNIRLPYLRHISLNKALPKIRNDIQEPGRFRPNWVSHPLLDRLGGPELFIGQADTVFGNVHQDQAGVHVGFVQLQGKKEIVIFPPADASWLYTFEGREFPFEQRNSAVNFKNLENYERFPLLRNASPRRIVLRPGQAMLLPADWWHTTRNLTDSVSYNIRIINKSNVLSAIGRHLGGIPRWLQQRIQAKSHRVLQ